MKTLIASLAVPMLVAAAPALAQATSPATYVAKAGASDLYERQSSTLVRSSKNAKVRDFAQTMIAHHTKSTADVKAAARAAGLRPAPPKLMPMQARMIADLRKASGSARDTLYVTQQKQAHQQALALHQGYAADGTSPPLKAAAAKIAPVVQSHLDMLNGM
jgi:putative membrane protein